MNVISKWVGAITLLGLAALMVTRFDGTKRILDSVARTMVNVIHMGT